MSVTQQCKSPSSGIFFNNLSPSYHQSSNYYNAESVNNTSNNNNINKYKYSESNAYKSHIYNEPRLSSNVCNTMEEQYKQQQPEAEEEQQQPHHHQQPSHHPQYPSQQQSPQQQHPVQPNRYFENNNNINLFNQYAAYRSYPQDYIQQRHSPANLVSTLPPPAPPKRPYYMEQPSYMQPLQMIPQNYSIASTSYGHQDSAVPSTSYYKGSKSNVLEQNTNNNHSQTNNT